MYSQENKVKLIYLKKLNFEILKIQKIYLNCLELACLVVEACNLLFEKLMHENV